MDVNNARLTISAVKPDQYPDDGYPEVALVGRSNVGKSSLTNTLINRRNLAHTSGQPGKTQTLNFYNIEDQLYFVDVPGYGYAKVSKKQRQQFGQMIENYLTNREQLCGVVLLVDGRHAPTADDVQMYQWLAYYEIPVLVVATKTDKVKSSQFTKINSQIKKSFDLQGTNQPIILFSAVNKRGKDDVWQWIENVTGVK